MSTTAAPAAPTRDGRRFAIGLLAVTVGAFVLRLVYVLSAREGKCDGPGIVIAGCPGDAWVYHHSANLLADGEGFISPVQYVLTHGHVHYQAADHPPLLTVLLSAVSFVGGTSWFAHELVIVLIGTASVAVAGLLGREVFGPRVGLLAAVIVAVNPNVWINDGNVLSESLSILLILLIAWAAYRFWFSPTIGRAALIGALIGLATLSRPEAPMLIVLLALPITMCVRSQPVRDRWIRLGTVAVVSALVVAPWVGYNLTRFNNPVTLSTGFGLTLSNTNCDTTYYGELLGYWSLPCVPPVPDTPGHDQSDDEKFVRTKAIDYIRAHERRVPVVVAARVGRMWNVFRPFQQINLDVNEGRPKWASQLALVFFYPAMLLAAFGVYVTYRRKRPVSPLVAPVVMVTISAAITFGHARYRAPAEGVLCVLVALGIDGIIDWLAGRRHAPATAEYT